jgi:hypothetical protein
VWSVGFWAEAPPAFIVSLDSARLPDTHGCTLTYAECGSETDGQQHWCWGCGGGVAREATGGISPRVRVRV